MVPCHRVIGKSGDITGYHWGLTRKRAMLGWEAGGGGVDCAARCTRASSRRPILVKVDGSRSLRATVGCAATQRYAARSSFDATVESALSR